MSSENHNEVPVRESVRQLGPDSWVIGGSILLSRTSSPSGLPNTWSDGNGAYFTVSNDKFNCKPLPLGALLPADGPIQKVHDAGDASAVWRIGDAFLKVRALHSTKHTREHVTLDYLSDPTKSKLTFPIPRALFHSEFGGRYYLITSRVPGQTLEAAWPAMDESSRQFCVDRLVDICKELVSYGGKGTAICGVDGQHLNENWMSRPGQADQSPQAQLDCCSEIRMDCSDLVLSHNDMGPYNIIVNLAQMNKDTIGVIDWEMAGFVPRDWIRTKFRICFAMDFDFPGHDHGRMSECVDWRRRVQLKLEQEGFHDVGEAYMSRLHASDTK